MPKEMTFDGQEGYFLTRDEYDAHTEPVKIARGQVWQRKMPQGSTPSYICIIAVDEFAEVAVDKIVNSPSDPTPKCSGSGCEVGYARTFKDIRSKYTYVRNS